MRTDGVLFGPFRGFPGPFRDRSDKAGLAISVGDVVTFGRGEHIKTIQIMDLGERRGPAEEAQALYRQLENDV